DTGSLSVLGCGGRQVRGIARGDGQALAADQRHLDGAFAAARYVSDRMARDEVRAVDADEPGLAQGRLGSAHRLPPYRGSIAKMEFNVVSGAAGIDHLLGKDRQRLLVGTCSAR